MTQTINKAREWNRDLVYLTLALMLMVFGLLLTFLMVIYSRSLPPQIVRIPTYEQHKETSRTETVRESPSTRLDNNRVRQQDSGSQGDISED